MTLQKNSYPIQVQLSDQEHAKKDLDGSSFHHLVELVENSLHPITEELKRWQSIIGDHYIDYKIEIRRNKLAKPPQ